MSCIGCDKGIKNDLFLKRQGELKCELREAMLHFGVSQKRLALVLGVNESTAQRLLDDDDVSVPVKVGQLMIMCDDDELRKVGCAVLSFISKRYGMELLPVGVGAMNGTVVDEVGSILVNLGKVQEMVADGSMDKRKAVGLFDEIIRKAQLAKAELGL